uniref:Uncharacterized protein n=1 Tax=Arundo donax TaxID=35708 RepID=A0A0A9RTA9_ARUDO
MLFIVYIVDQNEIVYPSLLPLLDLLNSRLVVAARCHTWCKSEMKQLASYTDSAQTVELG